MRFHKTALNLIVIDFASVEENINKDYYQQLITWGTPEETLKDRERLRLKLYYYLKHLNSTVKEHNNTKNIVFYVSKKDCLSYLQIISKSFPFIIYYNSLDFSWIEKNSGETREILESVKTARFNFDYSEYSPKKRTDFLKKYKIQLI